MKAIVNAKIVLVDSIVLHGVIVTDGDRIVDYGEAGKLAVPDGADANRSPSSPSESP